MKFSKKVNLNNFGFYSNHYRDLIKGLALTE